VFWCRTQFLPLNSVITRRCGSITRQNPYEHGRALWCILHCARRCDPKPAKVLGCLRLEAIPPNGRRGEAGLPEGEKLTSLWRANPLTFDAPDPRNRVKTSRTGSAEPSARPVLRQKAHSLQGAALGGTGPKPVLAARPISSLHQPVPPVTGSRANGFPNPSFFCKGRVCHCVLYYALTPPRVNPFCRVCDQGGFWRARPHAARSPKPR
jgi:hypothetical protein